MGRSVSALNRYDNIAYSVLDNDCDSDDWNDLRDAIVERITKKYPSFWEPSRSWDSNEVRIIAENKLAVIGIAEYCELVSLSIRAKDDEYHALALNFAHKVNLDEVLQSVLGKTLQRLGTMSNGEGVYVSN